MTEILMQHRIDDLVEESDRRGRMIDGYQTIRDQLKAEVARLTAERDALRAAHDDTWNAAIEAAEYIVKERAAELSDRSRRPVYTIAHRIRSLLRIRPEDRITNLSDE